MTDFLTDAEAREFREPVGRLVSAVTDSDQLWTRLVAELGVTGIAVPEQFGGLSLSLAHQAVVAEELGRQLAPVPFLASAGLGTALLLALGSAAQRQQLVPDLVEGKSILAVALTSQVAAVSSAAGHRLTGTLEFVLHGAVADRLIVRAELAGAERYFLLPTAGVEVTPMSTVDPTRPLARVQLDDAPADLLPGMDAGRAYAAGLVLLSAESLGAASECLRMTVDYLKVRRQFDRPIGSFQAVQHRAADMQGELESARAIVEAAAAADADLIPLAYAARARSADAFAFIARETIQLHGGIGFTWEHPAHRYFKRSLVDLQLLGHPSEQRAAIAVQLAG